jgi:CBS domain-containing protein
MKVESLMTKQVATCRADQSASEAAQIMWDRDCGFVPVVDDAQHGQVIGLVTDRDLCMAAFMRGRALAEIRIGDVMSTGISACKAGDDIASVEGMMRRAQVHRLPVVDDAGHLLGVISLADIACESARKSGGAKSGISASEVGETLAAIHQPRQLEPVAV